MQSASGTRVTFPGDSGHSLGTVPYLGQYSVKAELLYVPTWTNVQLGQTIFALGIPATLPPLLN